MESVQLSIVTGTRNREHSFNRLLHSVLRHTDVPFELIASDASDTPIDQSGFPDNVIIIPERPRKGCTAGYNVAFRSAIGKWVLWLNDDCEVLPGFASTAIDYMQRNEFVGLGAFAYSDPNHVGFKINQCFFGMDYANFGIISRELGNEVGWFDEEIVMYGNDNSLAYRVLMHGKCIGRILDARVAHHSEKDSHRIENNDHAFRTAQGNRLRAKYEPYLERMRAVQSFMGQTV